jgi:AraC-like DNA-binding protein
MPIIDPASPVPDFFSRQVREAKRFYSDLQPAVESTLTVVSGGWERCTTDYVIERERFPYLGVELVASGALSLELGGRAYDLSSGAVFAYGPSVPHRLRAASGDPPLKYFVDFAGTRAHALLRRAGLAPGRVRHVRTPLALRDLFDALVSAGVRGTGSAAAICSAILEAMLLTIGDTAVDDAPARTASYATYRRCRDWMDEHGVDVTSLAEVARRCRVDAAYLCRLFRRYDIETPYELILRLRMQRAAALLTQPNASVKAVAFALGFTDPFHFSRAFKRQFGVPPARLLGRTG